MTDSEYLRDKLALAITEADFASLHSGPPGASGANEISGGSPEYARVALTAWYQIDVGTYQVDLTVPFNLPADTDVRYFGLWSGVQYLDSVPFFASTVEQAPLPIGSVRFEVP